MSSEGFSLALSYLRDGGFVMWPLAVAAMVMWYGIGFRLLTLRRGSFASVDRLVDSARGGERIGGLMGDALRRLLPLARRKLRHRRLALRASLFPLRREMARYATVVRVVVIVAPLAGLLGTVAGMIETFDALGDGSLFSQSGGIAGGISQALISTQMGLAVAIPGLIVGRALTRRQRALESDLDHLEEVLCVKGSAALGECHAL